MTCEVIIIGSGVIGASIAYHLAARGCQNIIVIDKESKPGCGSTGKATGGFRCQFSTNINIQLSLLSRKKLLNFKDELGFDPGFVQAGYLFIASNQQEFTELIEIKKIQHAIGLIEVKEVSPEDIFKLNPYLVKDNEKIIGGVFSPSDGFIKPMNILNGYKINAEKLGVNFLYETECIGFKILNERITEALTSKGKIKAGYFINAAGAWAGVLAEIAGVKIPLTPQRRQIAIINNKNLLSEKMPMTIFINDGFHFRQRDGDVLLLYPEISSANLFDINVDDNWLQKVKVIADKRIKKVSGTTIDKQKSIAGLYEMTPDKHSIIGKSDKLENFYLANGSSGHGVMHSPAIGEIMAELILNGSFKEFDISPLRCTRFPENDLNKSSEYL